MTRPSCRHGKVRYLTWIRLRLLYPLCSLVLRRLLLFLPNSLSILYFRIIPSSPRRRSFLFVCLFIYFLPEFLIKYLLFRILIWILFWKKYLCCISWLDESSDFRLYFSAGLICPVLSVVIAIAIAILWRLLRKITQITLWRWSDKVGGMKQ